VERGAFEESSSDSGGTEPFAARKLQKSNTTMDGIDKSPVDSNPHCTHTKHIGDL
jgi:hypothetical protein